MKFLLRKKKKYKLFVYLCAAIHAQMVELVDTRDLKSLGQ